MTDHTLTAHTVYTRWQRFAVRTLAIFGWRVKFSGLPGPRGVLVVYPHTSNWDFIVGLFAKWAIGIRVRWLGKPALFTGPVGRIIGPMMRVWGGEPIERSVSTGAIERLAGRINAADEFWLAITPEGTRKYCTHWRSGFYHIARTARVPLGMACIDYGRKEVRLVSFAMLSGNLESDLQAIRKAYADCQGYRPDCAAPIELASKGYATASD